MCIINNFNNFSIYKHIVANYFRKYQASFRPSFPPVNSPVLCHFGPIVLLSDTILGVTINIILLVSVKFTLSRQNQSSKNSLKFVFTHTAKIATKSEFKVFLKFYKVSLR